MNEILKKRIEEAADNFGHLYPRVSVADVITFRKDAFAAGAEYALSHQWISVEEALPEYEEYMLVMHKPMSGTRMNPCIAYLHPFLHGKSWCVEGIDCHINLTNPDDNIVYAWMPIPKFETK